MIRFMRPARRSRPSAHRLFTSGVAIALVALLIGCQRETEAPDARPPSSTETQRDSRHAEAGPLNVVLITLDTTRADALGSYGQKIAATPQLDRLAEQGVQFLHCASSAPQTLPSHSTIFTGKFPYAHGARSNAGYALSAENTTLAEVLKAHGYATAAEVAAPVIGAHTQLDQGFDHYRDLKSEDIQQKVIQVRDRGRIQSVELPERDASDITRHAIQFIRSHRDEKFFLWLHYFDPHQPYSPPSEFREQAAGSEYHGEIRYVDHQIERVVAEIEGRGLRDRTVVVITADHGEGMGEHDEGSHSYFIYDSTIRVPLLLWGASIPRGLKVDSLVRTVDIAPTILDLLDLPALGDAQGVSLRALLTGTSTDLDLVAYGESLETHTVFGTSILRFLRLGRWKYIHKVDPELFNLSADPHEQQNLAAVHPDILINLRARLSELIAASPSGPADSRIQIDATAAEQLEALGYVAATPIEHIEDEVALLELSGEDPNTKKQDIQIISEGRGFLKTERYERAAERLRMALERNPESAPILRMLIEALLELDREEELIGLWRRMIELDPAWIDSYVKLARVAFQEGDVAEAEELLGVALGFEPCEEGPLATLAYLAATREDYARQLQVLRKGAEYCSTSNSFLNNYAYALATNPILEHRDGKEALRIALQITSGEDSKRPDFLDTLAAAQAENGDFASAIVTVKRALSLAGTGNAALTSDLENHLSLFEAGRPVREH